MSGFAFLPPLAASSAPKPVCEPALPLADAARLLQPGPQYWLGHTPDLTAMHPHELMRELASVEEWLRRQTASTPDVLRMEQVRDRFRGALAGLGQKAQEKKPKKAKAPGAKSAKKKAGPPAADTRPRTLREHSSRATETTGDLDAEYDDIVEGLQRDDLSADDRSILQTELANLSPSMAQSLAKEAAQRQAELVSGAIAAPNAQGRVDATDIAKRIDSVRPLPGHPGQNYLMAGHEMVVIPDAQLKAIRASVVSALEGQTHHIQYGTQQVQADLDEFVHRTYDEHPYVGFFSIIGSGENPLDWDEQIRPRIAASNTQINRFRDLARRAQDPWGDPDAPLAPMADAVWRADIQGDSARYAFDSRQDKMFEATASQVKVLQVAKAGGQFAANIAFTPAGAALYSAVEDSAVQGLEIHYGQRDSFDIAGILIDAGSAYVGGKVSGGVMGMAGKEASAARRLAFFVAGDRAGAVASSATWMGLSNAAGRTHFSASDFVGSAKSQLLDVPQVIEDYAFGKVGHAAHGSGAPKGPRGPRIPRVPVGGTREAPVARPEAPPVAAEARAADAPTAAPARPATPAVRDPALPGATALPQIQWQPIPAPGETAAPAPTSAPGQTTSPTARAPGPAGEPPPVFDPWLSTQGTRPEAGERTMRREEWKAKDRAERVEANEAFERHFEQLQQGDTSGGVGAGPLVQGGETYSNEAAMAKQRKAAVKRRASKRARRDPAVQQRLDDLAARVPPVQAEGANAHAQPPTPETPPQPLGVTGEQVEGAVDAAKAELKKQKVSGRPPREYGTLLHSELRASAEQQLGRHLAPGTEFYNDRTLAEITGMSAADAQLSVRDWLKAKGQPNPGLPADVLRSPIGSLKPDLVFREPHGATQMIDLTGQLTRSHFAKTVLYTMALGQR